MTGCKVAIFLAGLLSLPALASTADDIAALEAAKHGHAPTPQTLRQVATVHPFSLPDGREVNMNNYALVLFMGGNCHYSAQMDPPLKQLAADKGLKVYAYTLDGGGDTSFPYPMLPRKSDPNAPIADEIMSFFGNGLPIATPTVFMVNVNTMKAYPVSQGVMDMGVFSGRLATVIAADVDNLSAAQLAPMPVGQTTSQQ